MATTCSKSCGGGKQLQTRSIAKHEQNGGALCTGENIQEIDCNTNGCIVGNSLSLHLYDIKILVSLVSFTMIKKYPVKFSKRM